MCDNVTPYAEIKKDTNQEAPKVPIVRLEPHLVLPPRPLMDPKVLFKVTTLVHNPDEPQEEQDDLAAEMKHCLVESFKEESDEELSENHSSLQHSVDLELFKRPHGCITKEESKDNDENKFNDQERHSGVIIQVKTLTDEYKRKFSLQ